MIKVTELKSTDNITIEMYTFYYKNTFEAEPHKDIKAYISLLIEGECSSVFKILKGAEQVGFFSLQEVYSTALMGKTIEILDFWVSDEHRGMGVGKKVAEKICEIGRGRGCKAIELFTTEENILANSFWASVGFSKSSLQHYRKTC